MTPNQVEILEVPADLRKSSVPIRELGDLELALVGGGCGDVALA